MHRLGFLEHDSPTLHALRKENIGLIYSNTITNGTVLEKLSFMECQVISAVNELEFGIQYGAADSLATTQRRTNRYIACSEAVKNNLIARHHISSSMIDVIHGYIPIPDNHGRESTAKDLRSELKIPEDAFIVGASGTLDWRKSPDLFLHLARIVHTRNPHAPIHFIWLGGDAGSLEHLKLRLEIENLGMESIIHLVGPTPIPLDYFSLFDIFALTSREDPFPLVCLEAAALGKPVICFDKAGGMQEFVEDDCGFVIPFLDLDAMADRVIELYQSADLRNLLGGNAAKKVRERHDIEKCAPRVAELICRYMVQ